MAFKTVTPGAQFQIQSADQPVAAVDGADLDTQILASFRQAVSRETGISA